MISVCVPTRGRPDQFAAMAKQAQALASGPVEIIARVDTDDVPYPELEGVTYVRAERRLRDGHTEMSGLWTEAWRAATGDIAMLCGDDAVFETAGWDAAVETAFAAVPDKIVLVYANDDSRAPRPIMPFVSRAWIEAAGHFTPDGYPGWYADTWLWHIAVELRRVVYLPHVRIRHDYHEGADQTYREGEAARAAAGGNTALRGRFLGAEETIRRSAAVEAIRAAMNPRVTLMPPRPMPAWVKVAEQGNALARQEVAKAARRVRKSETAQRHATNTVVAVHCYAGDRNQVEHGLPVHQRLGCTVVVVSPQDAPVEIPGVDAIQAGLRGYIGRRTMDREREQLRLLLDTYPHEWFLLNDSDSFCLAPQIPSYLYDRPDVFWSNEVRERRPHRSRYPKIAFHPPYFAHRSALERLLTVDVETDTRTPFLDWYLMALVCESKTKHRSFPDGKSTVAWRHGALPMTEHQDDDFKHVPLLEGGRDGAGQMALFVKRGANMVHTVKHADVLQHLVAVADGRKR